MTVRLWTTTTRHEPPRRYPVDLWFPLLIVSPVLDRARAGTVARSVARSANCPTDPSRGSDERALNGRKDGPANSGNINRWESSDSEVRRRRKTHAKRERGAKAVCVARSPRARTGNFLRWSAFLLPLTLCSSFSATVTGTTATAPPSSLMRRGAGAPAEAAAAALP